MRCTQEMGLNTAASSWLYHNCRQRDSQICNLGHEHGGGLARTVYSKTLGMFEEEIPLYKYETKTGKPVYEYVQACPWSSGPCIFLALRYNSELHGERTEQDDPVKESLWDAEQIYNA